MVGQGIMLDLEMNPVSKTHREARKRLGRETIEIGAVRIDLTTYKKVKFKKKKEE